MTTVESSSSNVAPGYHTMPSIESASNISPSSKASGSTSAKQTTTLNKRQQTAQRARILALSKQLKTRLQYATFKVEHGWSKQSLSEVENLYYRHCKAAANSGPNKSPSSLRKANVVPSTPKVNSKSSASALLGAARSSFPGQGHENDAFGGLMTPPASGGTFPISHTAERDSFQMNPSFTSGLMKRDRSPTAGLEGKGGTSSSTTTTKQGKSYADFWSKIGTAGSGQASNERQ